LVHGGTDYNLPERLAETDVRSLECRLSHCLRRSRAGATGPFAFDTGIRYCRIIQHS
jgi:hypothetical protein